MWHEKQEIYIFNIILFIFVIFQFMTIGTFFVNVAGGITLTVINLLLFILMIPYAKWVWKTSYNGQALKQVLKQEAIILSYFAVSIVIMFLIVLIIRFIIS
jgi:hypothetical protein